MDQTPGDFTLQLGWMIESLEIDPFDSDHWLYGTGETIYGGHDLTKWDTVHNVTIQSLADGIEEFAVQDLKSGRKSILCSQHSRSQSGKTSA